MPSSNKDNLLSDEQHRALREIKRRVNNNFTVERMLLYGSAARGELDQESDIDLLILTQEVLPRKRRHKITDIVFEVNLKYGTNFSTLVVDINSWESGRYSVLPIYQEIDREGVVV